MLHAFLIVAIFVPYIGLMTGLGVYIYRTGQPRRSDGQDDEEDAAYAGEVRSSQAPRSVLR